MIDETLEPNETLIDPQTLELLNGIMQTPADGLCVAQLLLQLGLLELGLLTRELGHVPGLLLGPEPALDLIALLLESGGALFDVQEG